MEIIDSIQLTQNKIGQILLGVPKSTANETVTLELGLKTDPPTSTNYKNKIHARTKVAVKLPRDVLSCSSNVKTRIT